MTSNTPGDTAGFGFWDEGGSTQRLTDLGIAGCEKAVEIGRGGFSVVYRAWQPEFDRVVAVKLLSHPITNEVSRARYARELRALGALTGKPHIVTVFSSGFSIDKRPFLIMEYLPEGSMARHIEEQGPLSWEEMVQAGVQLAEALDAVHQAGILHRDIKPENVLTSPYGPKLADFGIARVSGIPDTTSASLHMSVAHAAPELLNDAGPTIATDIYALSSTLMTLVLRHPPFAAVEGKQTLAGLVTRIQQAPPPDLRPLGVPDAVCQVLERSLEKAPEDRPGTAAAFAWALYDSAPDVAPLPSMPRPSLHGDTVRMTGTGPRKRVVAAGAATSVGSGTTARHHRRRWLLTLAPMAAAAVAVPSLVLSRGHSGAATVTNPVGAAVEDRSSASATATPSPTPSPSASPTPGVPAAGPVAGGGGGSSSAPGPPASARGVPAPAPGPPSLDAYWAALLAPGDLPGYSPGRQGRYPPPSLSNLSSFCGQSPDLSQLVDQRLVEYQNGDSMVSEVVARFRPGTAASFINQVRSFLPTGPNCAPFTNQSGQLVHIDAWSDQSYDDQSLLIDPTTSPGQPDQYYARIVLIRHGDTVAAVMHSSVANDPGPSQRPIQTAANKLASVPR